MQLKGTTKDLRTIGQELAVQYVLEGSVRKAGNSLRITAQLIDVATDAPLWSDKYTGSMDDIFEVQERVSREIVKALGVRLTSDEHRRLATRPIQDPRAFELYLQARQEIRRYAVPRALPLLEEAIRIEGETPPLVAMRAWATLWMVRLGLAKDQSPLDEADRAARSLLAEHPEAPYGYALLGNLEYERSRLGEALRNFERAVELEPNDNDSLVMMAFTLVGAGQLEAAIALAPRMIECDPLSASTWMAAGGPLWFVGRVEECLPIMRKGLELDPHNFVVRWTVGYACALAGRLDEAKQHGAIIEGIFAEAAYTRQLLSLIDGLEGRPAQALERLAPINVAVSDAHQLFHLAESLIVGGDLERGLEFLERSTVGFHPYTYMAHHCRFLDPVRHLPRFQAVLAQAKERTEAFARPRDEMIEWQEGQAVLVRSFLALTAGILVLFAGKGINRRVAILREYNIPEPVTGGLLFALAFLFIYVVTGYRITFELHVRDILLVYFFVTIGINARIADLKAGGRPLVILLLAVTIFLVVQNAAGVLAASLLGLPPAIGVLAGSVSMLGGHGTAIAWAPAFATQGGVENAMEVGVLCATAGLVMASLAGGPLARFLVERYGLKGHTGDAPEVGVHYAEPQPQIDYMSFLRAILRDPCQRHRRDPRSPGAHGARRSPCPCSFRVCWPASCSRTCCRTSLPRLRGPVERRRWR